MSKIRSFLMALFTVIAITLVACGGGGGGGTSEGTTPPPSSSATPTPTEVGVPNGSMVSETIGVAGGSLSATDGKLALTIPAGALSTNAVIGIQPITNMAHGKIGAAYRLTPDGQTFLKPVTLTFPYTDQDLLGTAVEVLGAAFQTTDGYWQWAGDATVDTAAKTVSISSSHFTDVSLVEGLQIFPARKVIKTNGSVALQVRVCYDPDLSTLGPGGASLGFDCSTRQGIVGTLTIDEWSVNGRLGGGGTFGWVHGNGAAATYTAPANEPTPNNTVAVSARVHNPRRGPTARTLVVSNITIAEDSWTGTSTWTSAIYDTHADITWILKSTEANIANYEATGTATVVNKTPCRYDPLHGVITGNYLGELVIDYNADPPTYHGGGAAFWPVVHSCPYPLAPPPQHVIMYAPFFGLTADGESVGVISADGSTMEGSQAGGGLSIQWHFTRDR
jgi:hypothetical protein